MHLFVSGGISIFLTIGFFVKKTLNKNSIILTTSSVIRIKHLGNIGSIKQIIIDNKQKLLTKIFSKSEFDYRNAQFIHQFLVLHQDLLLRL